MSATPTSDDGSITVDGIFDQWDKDFLEAGDRLEGIFKSASRSKPRMEHAWNLVRKPKKLEVTDAIAEIVDNTKETREDQ